jgi:hypothetical protein
VLEPILVSPETRAPAPDRLLADLAPAGQAGAHDNDGAGDQADRATERELHSDLRSSQPSEGCLGSEETARPVE